MSRYQTLLGFDHGAKSIGVAIGQQITGTARPLTALKARDGQPDWNQVKKLLDEWQPDAIVVGLPLNMDGSEQETTNAARKFANRIHGRFGLPVFTRDERLTTADTRSRLFEDGGYRALEKGAIDAGSAQLILEDWMSDNSQ